MFGSWRRTPRPSPEAGKDRHRSIPVPMKGLDDGSGFKNSSGPEPSAHTPTAEFSKVKAMGSVTSLRRLVSSPDLASAGSTKEAKPPKAAKSTSPEAAQPPEMTAPPRATRIAPDAPATKPEDSWIWSLFKTDRRTGAGEHATDTDPNGEHAWAFWARKSDQGQLAVSGTETEHAPQRAEVSPPSPKRRKSGEPAQAKPSLVVPPFSSIPHPSRRARLASLLWSGSGYPHLVAQSPARPKRVVVIGVHGYFPARMTRAILGEPTGTSIKFANEAEARLQRWFAQNHPGEEIKVDKIALEGEGKIGHRVDRLYDLLMNWESLLRGADFVFFAVHSQGAVVTVNILSRLLQRAILSTKHQCVTVLSMAGSMLGPMPGMDDTLVMRAITRIEHDSLAELFGLQHVASPLSRGLQESLRHVLREGVKIVLVGSADDQLIPLYSALAVHVKHPNIHRAVYLDGEDVRPNVIAPLLQLATQQLNAGHTDHGVLREISSLLVGALTSKGHSKLYSHDSVYDLGLRVALETTPVFGVDCQVDDEFRIPKSAGANPYVLPWATQALVTESMQSNTLQSVVDELMLQFHSWKPETKPLKDLKLRLGGMSRANSKL